MLIKNFKKYWTFAKAEIVGTMAYKFSIYVWLISDVIALIFTCILWKVVYEYSAIGLYGIMPSTGYNLSTMMLYLIIAKGTMNLVMSSGTFYYLSEEIKDGTIAMKLIKPINYRIQLLFGAIGRYIINLIMFFLPIVLLGYGSVALFAYSMGMMEGFLVPMWYNIIIFMVITFLAVIVYDGFQFIIGQLAFLTSAIFGLGQIKDAVFGFLAGAYIPLALFPLWAQRVMRFLPFASLTSDPVLILMNGYDLTSKDGGMAFIMAISVMFFWGIILNLLGNMCYKMSVKHVVSHGG